MRRDLNLLSDELLADLAKKKDDAAFSVLLDRYMPFINYKSRVYFISGMERQDLVQEARIGLYNAVMYYDASREASFPTFACICMSRKMSCAAKRCRAMKNNYLNNYVCIYRDDDSLEELYEAESNSAAKDCLSDPQNYVLYMELRGEVESALENDLTEMERQCFAEYLSGSRCSEIAEKYVIGAKSVDNALNRAKRKMQWRVNELR
jgi:RNA polymerase sporulation-specific sigma factor